MKLKWPNSIVVTCGWWTPRYNCYNHLFPVQQHSKWYVDGFKFYKHLLQYIPTATSRWQAAIKPPGAVPGCAPSYCQSTRSQYTAI